MNLLFIHESEKVKVDNNGNLYTDGSYSTEVWNRYFGLCDNLSILMRRDPKLYTQEECKEKFNYFDKQKINFIEINNPVGSIRNYISLKTRKKNNQIIEIAISRCDIAIIRLPSTIASQTIKILKKRNIPYLVEVVGCPWDALWNHGIKGKLLAPIVYFKTKKAVKNAKFVQYVSNQFLQKRYPTNGESIGCSDVVLPKTNEKMLTDRINKINSKKENKKIILGTLGAIDVKYKGHEYVLKALAKLKKEGYNNFEYHLVGAGNSSRIINLSKKLEIEDQIIIKGAMPHKDVFNWLKNIDIYIQPSNTEGLCRSLVEAMSMASPCIVSNAGGNPELVENKYVFKKKNTIELIKKIKLLSFNKEEQIIAAKINFNNSKNYEKNKLDQKRNNFYKKFLSTTNK